MKHKTLLLIGFVLVFLGGLLAWYFHSDGGQIDIKDVRFMGTNGQLMSGLLYVPPGVNAENPAPAVLAIHGYINSRETQAPYAIEFARRGYVVLALDQTGHGYSDPPAFANGFGGPDGLAYLRSLDIVDPDNIGLEGHSMGGWASIIAAATFPDGYKSINVQGSSTGTFGAPDGTAEFPRNFALTFATWDEFSALMWGAPTGQQIMATEKLQTLFGTTEEVVVGQDYGSVEDGTARRLYQPVTTHPGNHLNSPSVASAVEWMQTTLEGGSDLDPNNQVWQWNEIGRLIALIGMVFGMIGFGGVLLTTPYFNDIIKPMPVAHPIRGPFRYVSYLLTIFVPILTFFWLQNTAADIVPQATALFPQNITTGIMVWAVGNALITLVLFLVWHFTSNSGTGAGAATYGLGLSLPHILKAALLALCVVAFGYALLLLTVLIFGVDFRFWVVAIKPMNSLHFRMFLGYLPFFLFFFMVLGVALHGQLRLEDREGRPVSAGLQTLANVGLLVLGFIVLLLIQYLPMFGGNPAPFGEALLTVVAFQFIPLLTIVGIMMTFFFRKTGTIYVGAIASALFITWVIVAGQATHFPF